MTIRCTTLNTSEFFLDDNKICTAFCNKFEEKFNKINEIIKSFQHQVWPYIKELSNIGCHSLRMLYVNSNVLQPIIYQIHVISIVTFLFACKDAVLGLATTAKNALLLDVEGLTLSALAFLNSLGGAFLDLKHFLLVLKNGFDVQGVTATISLLNPFGFPIHLGVLVYSTARGTYDSVVLSIEINQIPCNVNSLEDLKLLRNYLTNKLGINESEEAIIKSKHLKEGYIWNGYDHRGIQNDLNYLKEQKQHVLARRTDAKIVNIMKNLQKHLKKEQWDFKTANHALKDIKVITYKKICSTTLYSFLSSLESTALLASCFLTMPPLVSPILGIIDASGKLANHTFQTFFMHNDLESPIL